MFNFKLKAGETKTFIFVLGYAEDINEPPTKMAKFKDPQVCAKELKKLKDMWEDNLNKYSVQSEVPELDLIVSTLNQ